MTRDPVRPCKPLANVSRGADGSAATGATGNPRERARQRPGPYARIRVTAREDGGDFAHRRVRRFLSPRVDDDATGFLGDAACFAVATRDAPGPPNSDRAVCDDRKAMAPQFGPIKLCATFPKYQVWIWPGSTFVWAETTTITTGPARGDGTVDNETVDFHMHGNPRDAFSLIEMVIVILIIGIVAAIAAPRLFPSTARGDQEATRRHLTVMRNAIDMHHQRNESYPANGELPGAMANMLNGPFPAPMIGSVMGKTGVYYDDAIDELPTQTDSSVDAGWAYKPHNGSLRLNVADGEIGSNW